MNRLLTSSSALFWGLQFAFLNPVLALLLVGLYGATPADVGWVLAVYNAGGLVFSLVIPAWADRTGDYLRPMLLCAVLTIALSSALALATALPLAVIALIALGGPAGVGSTLLFADLRRSGASTSDVMNTRAIVSFAWVAGPPAATLVMGILGDGSILGVLAAVGVLNVATTVLMIRRHRAGAGAAASAASARSESERPSLRMPMVVAIVAAFVLLQATNSAVMSILTLFTTAELGLPVFWGGVTLGVAALLEIPALWLIGRFGDRVSTHALLMSGCAAGVLYYVALALLRDPVSLLAAQLLNAWFFATVSGIGMTLFQRIIPRPGLATGIYMNTRKVGSIVSGPIIAIAGFAPLGYPGMFAVCAGLTVLAAIVLLVAHLAARRSASRVPLDRAAEAE